MAQSITKFMRWALMASGTIAFLLLMPWSFLAGNMMARIDLARGHAGMLVSGPPAPWSDCAATVLQGSNGMEMLPLALCSITSAEVHFEHGYNAAMHDAMKANAGRDINEGHVRRAALDGKFDHPHPRQ